MEFRYPKARLFAYNKLAGGDSCSSVMIQAVSDAGLMSEDFVEGFKSELQTGGNCKALQAAEKIIAAYMSERHDSQTAQKLSAAAFNQLTADVQRWKQSSQIVGDCNHCEEGSNNCEDGCNNCEKSKACRDMTPIVLDLLLQQIMRH